MATSFHYCSSAIWHLQLLYKPNTSLVDYNLHRKVVLRINQWLKWDYVAYNDAFLIFKLIAKFIRKALQSFEDVTFCFRHRQAATSVERSRARCQWHPKIRPRSVALASIGLTFQNESSISSVCLCTDASTTKLLGIWPTTAHQFRTLFSASACVQPAAIKSPFHATGSARTAVGLFLLLVRRSGTRSLPEDMRDPESSVDSYRQSLKTFLFSQY